ncbi:MAG: DUF87 domain-containing protein [Desulfurococcales archaeon]|nr:DUF87 domain-containing protein [Desulfurococcales archaeon]
MAEGRGLDDYMIEEGLSRLPELLRRADEKAGELGIMVGRVSRFHEIRVSPGGRIAVEVDPETYFSHTGSPVHRVGDYLVIVDPKERLVLARIAEISRSDLLSLVGSHAPADMSLAYTDPSSIATKAILFVEPVMERDWEGVENPRPATTSIEPQSPVIDPKPEVVQGLLGLPEEGILLGALATPAGLVKNGRIRVLLPGKALLQHVLIIGTTGSGKTTLLKNMAAYAYSAWAPDSPHEPVMVFIDLNDDFIQLPFDPEEYPRDDPVYQAVYQGVKPPHGVLVVLPVTEDAVRSALEDAGKVGEDPWCSIAEYLVAKHVEESLAPIIPGIEEARPRSYRRRGACLVEIRVNDKIIVYSPYTVNTTSSPSSIVSRLMPGLTTLAREVFNRTRERFLRKYKFYPPLSLIAVGIAAYLSLRGQQGQGDYYNKIEKIVEILANDFLLPRIPARIIRGNIEGILAASIKEFNKAPTDIITDYAKLLSEYKPSYRTLEALYRRILGLTDTGAVDVLYSIDGSRLLLGEEPGWGVLVETASSLGVPIVIDLAALRVWGGDPGDAGRVIAYRLLERLKAWKHELWARRSRSGLAGKRIVVVIDEAHQFFPQERGERDEKEESRQVAGMISRIARLGRARGIGLVFATHSPKDLHDIIVQLANTKIVLRTERSQLESVDLPGDAKHYIPRLPDRYMVVSSFAFRDYLMAATAPPVVLHYDLSR